MIEEVQQSEGTRILQGFVQANERANQHYLDMRGIERLILNHEFGDVELPNIAELIHQVATMRVQQQCLDNRVEQLRDPESHAMHERARMAGLRLPHSGAWLNVVPSPALGLHLRP